MLPFSSPRRWMLAQSKSLIPGPGGVLQGSRRSDINKKSELTELFTGLMSFYKVSHLSGENFMMVNV